MNRPRQPGRAAPLAPPRRQRGISLILFVVGSVALIAMAGLALDIGYAYLTKTRLQNALDASALDGAQTLNTTFSASMATADALATFGANMGALAIGITPTVQTSATLSPFVAGSLNPRFVRVRVSTMPVTMRLLVVLGIGTFNVGGTAVAGPKPEGQVCSVLPVMVCGQNNGDTDCSDGDCYGLGGPGQPKFEITYGNTSIGPGNYGYFQLNCAGGNCLRTAMAGGDGGTCIKPGQNITSEPGNATGPADQGFNTRFGIYHGGMSAATYPPDTVSAYNPVILWATYQILQSNKNTWDHVNGVPGRRVTAAPIIDCSTPINGSKSVPILGIACFFLTQPISGPSDPIWAQLVPSCEQPGTSPPNPGSLNQPFHIVLYQDPDSPWGS